MPYDHHEKALDMGNGLSIWRVGIDLLREQDKNARVMSPVKFERLTATIKRDKRLETLPLTHRVVNPAGNTEFRIISGHHRIRAARAAEVFELFVLVIEQSLSKDQVTAKQLAHNSLAGADDTQLLQQLYDDIKEIDSKLEAGITEEDLTAKLKSIKAEDLKLSIDFEMVTLLFMPSAKTDFENVVTRMIGSEKTVYAADIESWAEFKKAMRRVSLTEDIRNATAIVTRMAEIVNAHYDRLEEAPELEPDE